MTRRRDDDPDGDVRLPLGVTSATNGEYVPDPPIRHDLDIESAAVARADEAARAAGMDRRRFLRTAGGVAAVLATVDLAAACSSGAARASAPTSTTSRATTTRPSPHEAGCPLKHSTPTPSIIPGMRATTADGGDFARRPAPQGCATRS